MQETRVCERVDEVDCSKSEKFYSLNLELYGSTAPPIISADQPKAQGQSTEQSVQKLKPNLEQSDPSLDESTTLHFKVQEHSTDIVDSTEDPLQDIKKDDPKGSQNVLPTYQSPSRDHEEILEGIRLFKIYLYMYRKKLH